MRKYIIPRATHKALFRRRKELYAELEQIKTILYQVESKTHWHYILLGRKK